MLTSQVSNTPACYWRTEQQLNLPSGESAAVDTLIAYDEVTLVGVGAGKRACPPAARKLSTSAGRAARSRPVMFQQHPARGLLRCRATNSASRLSRVLPVADTAARGACAGSRGARTLRPTAGYSRPPAPAHPIASPHRHRRTQPGTQNRLSLRARRPTRAGLIGARDHGPPRRAGTEGLYPAAQPDRTPARAGNT